MTKDIGPILHKGAVPVFDGSVLVEPGSAFPATPLQAPIFEGFVLTVDRSSTPVFDGSVLVDPGSVSVLKGLEAPIFESFVLTAE
ncbi:hypothetical protein [uncultured Jannaschia sp.]|uniref:hypothetical protein n=1 Tax=uncultured Jannaschia sp. TaxID=293347 RepID=UPI0026051400|nr:hypothetical protein [uncultured Jannaschia sp.]